jgi:hypothetical protein
LEGYSYAEKDYPITLIKEESKGYGKKKRKNHIQMDKILKRLFTLKNTIPIIDFLNAAYNDNISYEAKLHYADKEISNFEKKSSRYISFYADMYIK